MTPASDSPTEHDTSDAHGARRQRRSRGTARSVDRPLELIVSVDGDLRLPSGAAAVLAKIIRTQLAHEAADDKVA